MSAYDWPGNVRELENTVQRALVLSESSVLDADDFSVAFPSAPPKSGSLRQGVQEAEAERLRSLLVAHGGNCARAARALAIPRTTLVSKAKKFGLI